MRWLILLLLLTPSVLAVDDIEHTLEGTLLTISYTGSPPYLISIRDDIAFGDAGGYVRASTSEPQFTINLDFAHNPNGTFFYSVKDTHWSPAQEVTLGEDTSIPTPATCLSPDIKQQLDVAWGKEMPLWDKRINNRTIPSSLANGNTYILYNIQTSTINLLKYAQECDDRLTVDQLAALYGDVFDYLNETPQGQTWICGSGCQVQSLVGKEVDLVNLQFMYAASSEMHAIAHIPPQERTAEMQRFAAAYNSFAPQYYSRMGERYLANVRNKMNMDPTVAITKASTYSISDKEVWVEGGMVEYMAANAADPVGVPMTEEQQTAYITFVQEFDALVVKRTSYPELTDFDGNTKTGFVTDYGSWKTYPDYAYSCYTGSAFPNVTDKCATETGWDISHARRFVHLFRTLHENRDVTGQEFPDDETMERFTNQVLYGASNKDLEAPLFTNFIDGTNGWYRVDYHSAGSGYPPYGLTDSIPTGGYGFLAEYNPQMRIMMENLRTASAGGNQFAKTNYKALNTSAQLIMFLPTLMAPPEQ